LYTMYEEERARHRAVGIYGAMGSGGAASGALLGGVLTQYLGWEWCLFVNVPITALAVVLCPALVPEGRHEGERARLDVGGALTMTGALLLFVYAIVEGHSAGWGSAEILGCLGGAVVLFACFMLIELRSRAPLIPMAIFKVRSLRGANVVACCMTAAMFAQFYFTTLYMQQVLGLSAIETGLAFTPLSVVTAVSSISISRVLQRLSVQRVLATVMTTLAIGLALLTRVSADGTYWDILGPLLLVAASFGVSLVALTLAALAGLAPGDTGIGSGLLNTSRRVGGAIGLAVMSTVAASKTHEALANGQTLPVALNDGFRWAYGIGAAVAFAGALAALLMLRGRLSERAPVTVTE
ncbi:MAG: MFS transporter, partial [Tepidiformaceae bacterium]